jgi:hypothetical protein
MDCKAGFHSVDFASGEGEVAERSKAAVLKTVEGFPLPGFESLPLRQPSLKSWLAGQKIQIWYDINIVATTRLRYPEQNCQKKASTRIIGIDNGNDC